MKRFSLFLASSFWFLTLSAPALIDTNNNGLSDLWEKANNNGQLFPTTCDPQADPDHDGWTNSQEAAAGTDPADSNPTTGILRPDVAHIPAVMGTDANGQPVVITPDSIVISWATLPGKQYTLLHSFDLAEGSWLTFDAPFIGNGNIVEYAYPAADADKLFWRVAIRDLDSDGDGLEDAEESVLNTGSADSDSDDDGLSDGEEIARETNPNDSDTDNDLLSDGTDADPKEILVDWERASEAAYILIDVDGPPGEAARDLNDNGQVLFDSGIWSGGTYTPIPLPQPIVGSFPNGEETQTYEADPVACLGFNSEYKLVGWSHVRYTSGQAAGGDGTDTAWAKSLGESAQHLADAVPFDFNNVLSLQPMGVDHGGRTFARNSYAFFPSPGVMLEGRRIVVSGLPGNDPPVFLTPSSGYFIDGQTWQQSAAVSRNGSLVTNTASAIDNSPSKTYQLAMWDSSLSEVALPPGTDGWFHPVHLNDLPNGKPALAGFKAGDSGGGVYLKNPITSQMEKCESLSGKQISIFAGDGCALTADHQLWRNGKLTPMRNLCERFGTLLDAGWSLSPLKSNKHGTYLLVATGPNGEVENKLSVPINIDRDEEGGTEEWRDIGGRMAKALPGQKINLRLNLDGVPQGMTSSDFAWSLDGKYFANYQATDSWAVLTEVSPTALKERKIGFYWAQPGEHTVTGTCTINGEFVTVSKSINVVNPKSRLSASIGKVSMSSDGTVGLNGIRAGILFQGKVDSVKPEFDAEGKWQFAQLINCGEKAILDDLTFKYNNHFGEWVLDTSWPYSSPALPSGIPDEVGDSPQSILAGYPANFTTCYCSDLFKMYVMFMPPGENTKWVPLMVLDWSWKWRATRSESAWTFVSTPSVTPSSGSADGVSTWIHPEWNGNFEPPSWVP